MPPEKRSRIRWGLWIFLIIVLASAGFIIWKYNYLTTTAIQQQIGNILEKAGIPEHSITYDRLIIQPFNKKIILEKVLINSGEDLKNVLRSSDDDHSFKMLGKINRIELGKWNLRKSIKYNSIRVGNIDLISPELTIVTGSVEKSKKSKKSRASSLGKIASIELGKLEIINGKVYYYDKSKGFDCLAGIDSLNCYIRNIVADTSWFNTINPVRWEQVNLSSSHILSNLSKNYTLETGHVVINTNNEYVFIENIGLRPSHFTEFTESGLPLSGGFNINNDELLMTGFDIHGLYNKRQIIAKNIEVNGLKTVFLNYSVEEQRKSDSLFITERLNEYPSNILVEALQINKADILFMEQPVRNSPPGILSISDLQISLTNLTNVKREIRRSPDMKMELSGLLMKEGLLHIQTTIPIEDTTDRCIISANLGFMQAESFNSLSENLGLVRFTSGTIDSMYINLTADKDSIKGDLNFIYHDLKVDMLREMNEDYRLRKRRPVFSFLANNIIKSQNDPEKRNYRSPVIRDKRSQGNTYIEDLSNSIKSAVIQSLAPSIDEEDSEE